MKWSAWYSETERYDSETTEWNDLPAEGLQVVIVYRDSGRSIYDGADWYWLHNGELNYAASGEWGSWKDRPMVSCSSCIKQGTRLPDEEFEAIQKVAKAHKP